MVSIATMGLFNECCHRGGGAVPVYRDEEQVKPYVRVLKFESKEKYKGEDICQNIQLKLVDDVEE